MSVPPTDDTAAILAALDRGDIAPADVFEVANLGDLADLLSTEIASYLSAHPTPAPADLATRLVVRICGHYGGQGGVSYPMLTALRRRLRDATIRRQYAPAAASDAPGGVNWLARRHRLSAMSVYRIIGPARR